MSERVGRVCEKHGEWCPDGVCRWCEPDPRSLEGLRLHMCPGYPLLPFRGYLPPAEPQPQLVVSRLDALPPDLAEKMKSFKEWLRTVILAGHPPV